ncbi:uncharacterized protein LOC107486902 [Arachis duranensis]|uniref:Uncharacterized protein LOC107486902 n=1 Tax=Arachis duranensis TaxID=130453 RepID=A0A6P4D637_ARADU|nr:uncharacterized protein LOC107486902 [Arachis duranensis]
MAIELCSENCGVSSNSSMSPRISFSHDFSQSDVIPVEQHPFGSTTSDLESSNDFDFCVTESFELVESFPADEFFSGGRIIPTEIKGPKKNNNIIIHQKGHHQLAPQHPPPLPPQSCVTVNHNHNHNHDHNHHYCSSGCSSSTSSRNLKKEGSSKEGKYMNNNNNDSKSFWNFKRSSSCGNGYRRSLCALPLLSRSNSTGSSSNTTKRNPLSKEAGTTKQNSHKHSSSSSSQSIVAPTNIYHQKPPLNNKSHHHHQHHHHGSYGNNSVRVVSPALNVHSANLFGLASIFSNNRDKSKKK